MQENEQRTRSCGRMEEKVETGRKARWENSVDETV